MVERAGLEHVERLAPLIDAYRGFYGQPSDVAAAAEFLRARLDRGESVVLMAVDGDGETPLGFVQLYPTFSSVRLSPVWILCEDDRIYFSVLVDSAKFRQLERDPRISLCIDAGHPDARAVMIRGRVEIIRETSAWSEDLSWRINRRYHASEDETRQYMELIATQGASALVAVSRERLIGRNFN